MEVTFLEKLTPQCLNHKPAGKQSTKEIEDIHGQLLAERSREEKGNNMNKISETTQ